VIEWQCSADAEDRLEAPSPLTFHLQWENTMGKKWRAEKPSGEVKDSLTTEEEHKEDGWMKPFGEK